MKAERINRSPDFVPVEIRIVFESHEEIRAFYTLFNYVPVMDAMDAICPGFPDDAIRNAVGEQDHGPVWEKFKSVILRKVK